MGTWRDRRVKPSQVTAHIKHLCDLKDGRRPRLTLLVGAGFSVTAGIPTAGSIVGQHLRDHALLRSLPARPAHMSEYAHYMSHLPPESRMEVIESCIAGSCKGDPERTQINWAHLLLATLVNHGYVKQILTTNFDPLLIDAMAITGQPVRTFDLTAADWYMPGRANRGSIMYLHGQSHGLLQAHTDDETGRVAPRIRSVLQEALADSTMIVVGYSGECDPVFDELSQGFPQFRNRLYWVYFDPQSKEPTTHLAKFIESPGREAFLLVDDDDSFMDADTAMHRIVIDGLQLPLMPLISNPLDHVRGGISRICGGPAKKPGAMTDPASDAIRNARDYVDKADDWARQISTQGRVTLSADENIVETTEPETREQPLSLRVAMARLISDVDELLLLRPLVEGSGDSALRAKLGEAFLAAASSALDHDDLAAARTLLGHSDQLGVERPHWLATLWGNTFLQEARSQTGTAADRLFENARAKYAEAVRLKPDMHEAFYNWGTGMADQARTKSGAEADRLFAEAGAKYAEAVRIKPDKHEAFYNWGLALANQAVTKSGAEADRLFAEAGVKYAEVVRIKPDKHEALNNWGLALTSQAVTKSGAEADILFAEARAKYAEVVRLQPDKHEAFYNWGTSLTRQAQKKSGAEADRLFVEAGAKYGEAVRIKPDMHEAFYNWGLALAAQARIKSGAEAARLFAEAGAKYGEALRIKPDQHEAFNNWGVALAKQAEKKSGAEADTLFDEAETKYAEALRIKPDKHEVMFNSGCLAAQQGKAADAIDWLRRWAECNPSASRLEVDTDSDFDRVRQDPAFQAFVESLAA